MRRRVLAGMLVTAVVAGCGDDYPDRPQDVAKRYVGTNAASKCRYLTQRLIETLTAKKGAEARAACRRNVVRVPKPEHVELREAEVEEHEADVEVVLDGKEAKLTFVRSDGRWRINGFSD